MREVAFVPAVCKSEKEGAAPMFQGHLKIRVPSTPERYGYMDLVGPEGMSLLMNQPYKAKDDSDAEKEMAKKSQAKDAFEKMRVISKLFGPFKNHVTSVDIKKSDGTEYKSFEDLTYDSDCDPILIEGSMLILNGFKPEKN